MKPQIIFDFYNTLYDPKTRALFVGTPTLLDQLKKEYRLILVTTSGQNRKRQVNKLGITRYFSEIIICPRKSLKLFLELIKNNPDTTIIGDRKEEEISIAKLLKLSYIQVTPQLENPIKTITKRLFL